MAPNDTPPTPRATRILCVDDEPALREVLAMHLRRNAYVVETAADGLAAWQLVSADFSRFDVVVTDNQMPNLDGVSLVEKLRDAGYRGKIVFFSSTLPQQASERLERLGIDAIVEKGRAVSELMTALSRAVGRETA